MKNWIALAALLAMMSVSLPGLAAGKTVEERCKAQAERHKIAADKLDAYVKTCIEKHHRTHKAEAKSAPAPAAPASPASGASRQGD